MTKATQATQALLVAQHLNIFKLNNIYNPLYELQNIKKWIKKSYP